MTRTRAIGMVPTKLMAQYYAQRASAGLIVSECTMVARESYGYINCPGIFRDDQEAGWKQVVDAVHKAGGRIFLQLWHAGRVSHPALQEDGAAPVAPSALSADAKLHTPAGKVTSSVPRALATEEIAAIVDAFAAAAKRAQRAGFDGVELHGAFGYLIDQFLQDGANQRTDAYGGSIANRCRFALEVVDAVAEVWGSERVGIKLSPSNTFYNMGDSNPGALFDHLLGELSPHSLAYVHLMEPNEGDLAASGVIANTRERFRASYGGTLISNGGHDRASAQAALDQGTADLVSFGKPFLANPDLPRRFAEGQPLNQPDPRTFYGIGEEGLERGYTDYPALG